MALALAAGTTAAWPQPKTDAAADAIRAAQKAYRSGQLLDAKQKLDAASELIAAAAAKKLYSFLPDAHEGWTIDPNDSEPAAAAVELTASRSYAKGPQRITISISGDMRILAALAFTVMDAAQAKEAGARLIKINGTTGVVTSDGQIQILVANRFLVMAEGDAGEETKKAFLEAIDVKGLSKL
jgi:uncharacterized protein YdbL (DUF1318 family)